MTKKHLVISAIIAVLLFISPMAFAVEFGVNSANITNRYYPATLGSWRNMLGVGNVVGSTQYWDVVGIEEVSGVQIAAQTFNNVKCLKVNIIGANINDENDFFTLWMAQDTQGNLWILKAYSLFEDTTFMLGADIKSMFMPAVPNVGDPASIIVPETATNYCRVVEVYTSINTTFGSYDSCIKTHCFYESSLENVEYYCPDFGQVRYTFVGDALPEVWDLKGYGAVTNTKAEIIGTWSNGI